jgi:GNAT superfamily N-acetyltransferase
MIEFEPGGRGVEPRQVAFAGRQPGSMRHVPAEQFHHFQWHLLRVQGGLPRSMADLVSATLLPTSGVHPGATGRVITGFFVGLHMRGAAELREFLPRPDGDGHTQIAKAQVALSVESAWQGRGIGTALMAETLRTARERGIDQLHLTCHVLNRRMQRLAERFGATIGFEGCECFAEIAVRDEAWATGS